MSRRESVGRIMARKQSSTGEPEMQMVSVAVLPPRLPSGMAPPTGIGAADAFSWDEAVNYQHNDPIQQEPEKKSLRKRLGLTTERQRKNPDNPPFIMRQIPYSTWRKHYAKDINGNYKGTHAPAEDCLLKPEDVAKWRLEAPQTVGDRWTRGSEILPVYSEIKDSAQVPDYEAEYDYASAPPTGQPGQNDPLPAIHEPGQHHHQHDELTEQPSGKVIANGKTAAQIIEEAKSKPKPKKTWRQSFKDGATNAMLGGGA